MPKKENGFGKSQSFDFKQFKDFGRVDKGKGKGAAGLYPSNRRYGSSVQRSVIEKWDLDSNWVKWRKGYEYYNRAAWYQLETYDDLTQEYEQSIINSVLYQGTPYEVDVEFIGYKFATKNADSNNHYVAKRTPTSNPDLGFITQVKNDPYKYDENQKNREIWCKGVPGADAPLLLRMIGERLTDGETEASLTYVLDSEDKPALYIGKSFNEQTTIEVIIPLTSLINEDFDATAEYQNLAGQVVYIPDFYVEKPVVDIESINWIDAIDYFGIQLQDTNKGVSVSVLDASAELLPPSLYDISTLPVLFSSNECTYKIKGTYIYQKELYQRFFGRQYLTADVVKDRVDTASYSVMPFTILSVSLQDGNLVMTSVPATTSVELYAPIGDSGTVIFTDYSFTKSTLEDGDNPWLVIDTDVDPWMDEVFTSGNPLRPATLYTCSCPNHSHSILSAPQQTEESGERKINRQRRYPLPTVLGQSDFDSLGKNQAAGRVESWESREHKMSFKMCKHSIAAMFIERIKIKEPDKYPTVESREAFEEKLSKEMDEVGDKFNASYRRGGITTLEVVFALAQGLNLDDVELAYVILNSNF
jgi:hypothetical protein